MTAPIAEWSDFSINEWHRLDRLAASNEQAFKTAYLQTVVQGKRLDSPQIRQAVADTVISTCVSTAPVYGMVFDPSADIYHGLVNELTAHYMSIVNSNDAQDKVKRIIPRGLSMVERRKRLDTAGLDARSAIQIERMHQEGKPPALIQQEKMRLAVQRGNLIALTETNRIINMSLETMWIQNLTVSKAKDDSNVWYFDRSIPHTVRSISDLPRRAKKEWLTRRDDRVCNYCLPLEGVKARIGAEFDTEYGFFQCPPIHPRCRCFMVLSI